MIKALTFFVFILATTATQPVWGTGHQKPYTSLQSEIDKIDARISAAAGNLAYARSRGLRREAMHFITVNSPTSRSSSRPALPDIISDITLPPIRPVDQGTIRASDTDTTVEITGNGFFRVDPTTRLLSGNTIDPVAELRDYLEVQRAYNRTAEGTRLKELLRRHAMSLVRLLEDDTPQDPNAGARIHMNRVLNELLSNPPQLKHIVPPEK